MDEQTHTHTHTHTHTQCTSTPSDILFSCSFIQGDLYDFENSLNRLKIFYNREVLCTTLNGNNCPIITITAVGETTDDFSGRDYIMLTARVHPGESNASWVMRGW